MSSWGIRMELLRIEMRAPCHQGEGSLHLAHADGPPCNARHSSFHPGEEFCPANIPPSPDISHPTHDAGWERRVFQFPRSNMSGSSDRAYPESIRNRQFRFLGQLGSSDTCDSPDPFLPTIKKQTLIILTTKSSFCTVQRNFS